MPFRDHPLLKGLRFHKPRRELPPARQRLIEAIGRDRGLPALPGQWPRLPRDSDLAEELGITVATLRTQIGLVADNIEGLEELEPKTRIWLAYRHDLWLEQQAKLEGATNTRGSQQAS